MAAVAKITPEEKEFQTWMKTGSAMVRILRNDVEGKNAEQAASDTQKLVALFAKVNGFCAAKEPAAAIAATQKKCSGCHNVNSEKLANGSYTLKY